MGAFSVETHDNNQLRCLLQRTRLRFNR